MNFTSAFHTLLKHVSPEDVPPDADILSADNLETDLAASNEPPWDLLMLGDVMLGDRAAQAIQTHGLVYPFAALQPLFRRSRLVVANLEAPFTTQPRVPTERFAYQVDPALAAVLRLAGISAVNRANNHLLDCGPEGVLETLRALAAEGIASFGAGRNTPSARQPWISTTCGQRVGFLGYYWNERCSAGPTSPGCAMSLPDNLRADIAALKSRVDRVIVSLHWGTTYVRDVSPQNRDKAHLAIESGADLVVGHHPHIIQSREHYRGKEIFYSLGNALMGSGNSLAEGLALAIRFSPTLTCHPIPLYVKNRDPRIAYQTKVLAGLSACALAPLRGVINQNDLSRGSANISCLRGAPRPP